MVNKEQFFQILSSIAELLPLVNEFEPIFDSVDKKVFLIEVLQRFYHFVKSNGPILPALVLLFLLNIVSPEQIVSPSFTDKNGIASQRLYKLFVFDKDCPVFEGDFVLVAIAA